uniref:Serpin domain-containing protein n=1 Tax=Panagrolaimus davidi TaxID=227884 RepID=A0A914QII9_9BILA
MIHCGANNKTAEQIADVIGRGKDGKEILQYYSEFVKRHKLQDVGSGTKYRSLVDEESVKVNIAIKIFESQSISLLPEYQNLIKDKFDSQSQKVNFADKVAAATEINYFIRNATNGMIKSVITPDEINQNTDIALINAIHFTGIWEQPFEDRQKKIFYSNPEREIDMMKIFIEAEADWNLTYMENEWHALGIPYKSRKAWLYIILPTKKDGLNELIKKFDYEQFKNVTTRDESNKLNVTIPVIETEASLDLAENLKKLGIIDVFKDNCDLSKMLQGSNKINKAVHKAAIKIDEKGTEASAATVTYQFARSAPGFFVADHPFLYMITSTENSVSTSPKDILFMGTFC